MEVTVKAPLLASVDLSKAKVGQIAHFRCGGKGVISKVAAKNIYFNDCGTYYDFNGSYGGSSTHRLFDIIRLEDPPFDWSMAKAGMAFKVIGEETTYWRTAYFLSRIPEFDDIVLMTNDSRFLAHTGTFSTWTKSKLVRAPECDIQL